MPDVEPILGRKVHGPATARWEIDGRHYVNFAGSSYLALAHLPELRESAYRAIALGAAFAEQFPPPYGCEDTIYTAVEDTAARLLETPAAVFFTTGYFIGAILLAAHARPTDQIFLDEGAHYNMRDAARLSDLPVTAFPTGDAEALAAAIARDLQPGRRPLVMTDGTYATTGLLAPLREFADVAGRYEGLLLVDDAHGFGAFGASGRGAVEHLGVDKIARFAGTLSKSFSANGAVIGCSAAEAERINAQPPKRGANAGSTISATVADAAMRYMTVHPERRERLAALTRHARQSLRAIGLDIPDSPAPIIAFRTGPRATMRAQQHALFAQGIYLPISNYLGAGPDGIFRCAIFADHDEADIDRLAEGLAAL